MARHRGRATSNPTVPEHFGAGGATTIATPCTEAYAAAAKLRAARKAWGSTIAHLGVHVVG